MDCLGSVEGITTEGHAIVKCDALPDIGNAVFDMNKHRVGTVKRIFGPVDSPYASVTTKDYAGVLKGKKLYFNKSGKNGKTKRGNRGN